MYTMSPDAKKPSRAKAYELVAFLRDGIPLHKEQIDSLLLYFAPALPKKPKTPMEWVAQACDTTAVSRDVARFVYVKNNRAVGSDGHRVHVASVDMPDGAYCPQTLSPVDQENLFDIAIRVGHWPDDLIPFEFADLRQGIWKDDKKPLMYYRVPADVAVNADYLKQAISAGEPVSVYFGKRRGIQILTGEGPFGKWLIAGMRI